MTANGGSTGESQLPNGVKSLRQNAGHAVLWKVLWSFYLFFCQYYYYQPHCSVCDFDLHGVMGNWKWEMEYGRIGLGSCVAPQGSTINLA